MSLPVILSAKVPYLTLFYIGWSAWILCNSADRGCSESQPLSRRKNKVRIDSKAAGEARGRSHGAEAEYVAHSQRHQSRLRGIVVVLYSGALSYCEWTAWLECTWIVLGKSQHDIYPVSTMWLFTRLSAGFTACLREWNASGRRA